MVQSCGSSRPAVRQRTVARVWHGGSVSNIRVVVPPVIRYQRHPTADSRRQEHRTRAGRRQRGNVRENILIWHAGKSGQPTGRNDVILTVRRCLVSRRRECLLFTIIIQQITAQVGGYIHTSYANI